MNDITILGGGWAGLSSAYHMKRLRPELDIQILESRGEEDRGGLLRSEIQDGFTFDIAGPHILFSRNRETLKEIVTFLGDNVKKHKRNSHIIFDGKYVPYPFENGIYKLNSERRAEIGLGLVQSMIKVANKPEWKPDNFREWIYEFFGEAMARDYLEPYNRKIWKRNLSELDADWAFSPGRLPYPELKEIIKSIAGVESSGYKEQAEFFYPKHGGIMALYDSLLTKVISMGVRVSMSTPVTRVRKQRAIFNVNGTVESRRILNTLPPNTLAEVLESGEEIKRVSKEMDYNRVIVVGVAVNAPSPCQHAIYVPDPNIVFHRFTWMNNLTSDSPKRKSNLIAEITIPYWEKYNLEDVKERTIRDLLNMEVIESERVILFSRVWMNEFGYPIYSKGHNKIREEFFRQMGALGMSSVGRWGSWHYWNTDKVFEAARTEAMRLLELSSPTEV